MSFPSRRMIASFFVGWAVLTSLYHVGTAWLGTPVALFQRPMHLTLMFVLLFYVFRRKAAEDGPLVVSDVLWMAGTLIVGVFTLTRTDVFLQRIPYMTPLTTGDWLACGALLLIVLEAARRTTGLALPIVCLVFLGYAVFGSWMPPGLQHRGIDFATLVELLYMSTDGFWGVSIAASATFIVMFSVFAAFLMNSGVGAFFNDLAISMTARTRGGPAKTAVVASYFMGMISGASTTNVVTTGAFTIPMMKRAGYSPAFAGAVEAASSTGSQLMPPIMGVAAFLMVQFTGISYFDIVVHAIVPGVLYYFSIFMIVHFRACRIEVASEGWQPENPESPWQIIRRRGHLALPIFVMLTLLLNGYTAQKTALYGTLSVLALSWVKRETRMGWREIMDALEQATRWVLPVAAACAAAGIIVGMVQITGLSVKISNVVLTLSSGYLSLTLVLTMIVAIVLGMGMPTSGAYIIMATLLAPALINMGVPVIAAHMFIFYFACLSAITPPVALASYAAAGIAGANPTTTSLQAFRCAMAAYIVPFMFVYEPALLMIGTPAQIVLTLVTAVVGIVALAGSAEGYFFSPANTIWQRCALFAAGLLMIRPGPLTDLIGLGLLLGTYFSARFVESQKPPGLSKGAAVPNQTANQKD
ncbi:MAG: TRAP transporter permease [Rhizobiaceae bacterium]|nr:TRAP transporter permease [Rhizobiaceae bacterium]